MKLNDFLWTLAALLHSFIEELNTQLASEHLEGPEPFINDRTD